MPEDRKLPLLASEAKEVKNYSVHHPIRQSILFVQDNPDQERGFKTHKLVDFKIRTASNTIVLHPTFELATFGEIEWRASDDFADAEK